jgi:hypothetical protein
LTATEKAVWGRSLGAHAILLVTLRGALGRFVAWFSVSCSTVNSKMEPTIVDAAYQASPQLTSLHGHETDDTDTGSKVGRGGLA